MVERLWRIARAAALLAGLWWILTGGARDSWIVGGVAVAAGVVAGMLLPPLPSWRWSLPGLIRFVPYFAWHSITGGVDVARRALDPRRPLAPRVHRHRLRLPPGPARVFYLNTLSLLPGTLSLTLDDETLLVHLLDASQPFEESLDRAEQHVAKLFGVELAALPKAQG